MGARVAFDDLRVDEVAIGIDVGGTKTLGVAVDRDGVVRASVRRPTIRGDLGVVDGIAAVVTEIADLLPGLRAVSVGVGVPGLVDPEAGVVVFAVNVALEDCPLGALVTARTGLPARVENDVALAAFGESSRDPDAHSLALISIGTGLAVGLVSDGEMTRGESAAAGEIGHLPIDPDGEPCGCGQRGCLELVLSGPGIDREWPEGEGGGPRRLVEMADAGDDRAVQVLEGFVERLAWAVQLLALTVDPDRILVGGGVAGLGDALVGPVRALLQARAEVSPFVRSLRLDQRFMLASGPEAAASGAALHGLGARLPVLVT
ncbi:ROK family protein [Microbacterium sp. NPDC089320]|uniref:ROK family protein n=1 Tax=Microbacterium sp. NPDC089320 TaxID=3155182 RepID=UPI003437C967